MENNFAYPIQIFHSISESQNITGRVVCETSIGDRQGELLLTSEQLYSVYQTLLQLGPEEYMQYKLTDKQTGQIVSVVIFFASSLQKIQEHIKPSDSNNGI